MSYPKRTKGWRNVTINDRKFRWRFHLGKIVTLTLQGHVSYGQQVVVTLHRWYDPWAFIAYDSYDLLPNDPPLVTAKFACEAVNFSLAQGWNPEKAGPPLLLDYKDKVFALSTQKVPSDR